MISFLNSGNNIHSKIREIIRFGIIGIIAMLIHYGIYYCLSQIIDINIAFTLGYAISFAFNYFASTYFTFKTTLSLSRFTKFSTSHAINYLLQIVIFNIAIYLGINSKLAPIMVYMISIPVSFIMVKLSMNSTRTTISFKQAKNIIIIFTILIIYGLSIFNSSGYYYPDEHFQIIEFARWKMGESTPEALPWELHSEIRPSLQPFITIFIFKFIKLFGIDNPFRQAFVLRAFMTCLMIFSIWRFTMSTAHMVKTKNKTIYIILSYFIWFIPYLCARYSSETMSASCLLLALSCIYNNIKKNNLMFSKFEIFKIALLFCLAFEFRYQMAFAIIGFILWGIYIAKINTKTLLDFTIIFISLLILFCFIDTIFYGHFTIAPWNYFRENIINGVASTFGVSPWYMYFVYIYNSSTSFIGILIISSILFSLVYNYKSLIVWIIVFFIAGHSLIGHKELRFLFPMVYFLPLLIIIMTEKIPDKFVIIKTILTFIFIIINTGGLLILTSKSTRFGRVDVLEYIYFNKNIKRVICSKSSNPYKLSTLSLDFYWNQEKDIEEDIDSYILGFKKLDKNDILILNQGDNWRRDRALAIGLKEIYKSIPQWTNNINKYYNTYNPYEVKIVYGYTKKI